MLFGESGCLRFALDETLNPILGQLSPNCQLNVRSGTVSIYLDFMSVDPLPYAMCKCSLSISSSLILRVPYNLSLLY